MNVNTPEGMDAAIRWMDGVIAMIIEGGTWAIPRSATIYQISKTNKTFLRLIGDGDHATEIVLEKMGWKVETKKAE